MAEQPDSKMYHCDKCGVPHMREFGCWRDRKLPKEYIRDLMEYPRRYKEMSGV